jgi:hypothetical protein
MLRAGYSCGHPPACDLLSQPLRRRYEAAHRGHSDQRQPPKKGTKVEALTRAYDELWTKFKRLERESKGDGSLFDLRADKVEDIALVIAETVTFDRLKRLTEELADQIAKRKPKAHAG